MQKKTRIEFPFLCSLKPFAVGTMSDKQNVEPLLAEQGGVLSFRRCICQQHGQEISGRDVQIRRFSERASSQLLDRFVGQS